MAQFIDKAAVVTGIKKLSAYLDSFHEQRLIEKIISIIDTLEVKEVDLEKEIELVKGDYEQVDVAWNNDFDFIAKHFFELGIKAQKDILKNNENRWKPSDEQMYNLSEAAHYNCAFFDMEILKGLYDDLKKLRDE